jgi:ATP-dependent Clp protease ATP-binding subunit ClpA
VCSSDLVLDEGMLVDAFGRITNFRNTIIIMTTNLGASNRQSVGFGNGMPDEATYNTAIAKYFRPEFVNRIDSIVMFNPLNAENIQAITIQELHELKQREGFTKIGLKLEFSEKLLNHLASVGFDERYGARPLQRAIEREVVAPLAQWILGNPKIKNTVLKVDYEGGLKVN